MKTKLLITGLTLLALSTLNSQLSTAYAQGSLTPPGQPAPTMKSADQIEPRTIVNAVNTPGDSWNTFVIRQPGSYYLITNLMVNSQSSVIAIATSDVTLDLNGFTISYSIPNPGTVGIALASGVSDITIINGHINCGNGVVGIGSGVTYNNNPPTNVVISKVSVSGAAFDGITLGTGNATVVQDCTVTTAGGQGIVASIIKNSVATGCASNAIYGDTVSDCRGISTDAGYGVYASATAQNCYGQSNSGTGLQASIAIGCVGSSTSGIGLQATIANSCIIAHGTTNVTYHCNMPW
jgi:hypothetical protein